MDAPAFTIEELDASMQFRHLWRSGVSGQGITAAILDTGIEQNPALDACIVERRDFTPDNDNNSLAGNHGSMMAQCAHVVAPQAGLAGFKVIPKSGEADRAFVCAALQHCIDTYPKYRVVNLSLWFDPQPCRQGTCPLCAKITQATERGIVVIAAAGNFGPKLNTITCPGIARDAFTVGASLRASETAWWQSLPAWEKWWIKNTGKLEQRWGTSFSSAYTAGAAALLLSAFPQASVRQLKDSLRAAATAIKVATSQDLSAGGGSDDKDTKGVSGAGALNCAAAATLLLKQYGWYLTESAYANAKDALRFNSANEDAQKAHSPYLSQSWKLVLEYVEYKLLAVGAKKAALKELEELKTYLLSGAFPEYAANLALLFNDAQ